MIDSIVTPGVRIKLLVVALLIMVMGSLALHVGHSVGRTPVAPTVVAAGQPDTDMLGAQADPGGAAGPRAGEEGLPQTKATVQPYVVLGGSMLGFGLVVLGLAWVLGRRAPND